MLAVTNLSPRATAGLRNLPRDDETAGHPSGGAVHGSAVKAALETCCGRLRSERKANSFAGVAWRGLNW